jgi:hypothetical protein
MPWVEIFTVFALCHLTGDFAFQTEWQAQNKRGGLGPSAIARRALAKHVATYTLAFVPAFIWLWEPLGAGVFAVAAIVAGTHFVQDDGRLIDSYVTRVKGTASDARPLVAVAVDQTFHALLLFALAVAVSS